MDRSWPAWLTLAYTLDLPGHLGVTVVGTQVPEEWGIEESGEEQGGSLKEA